MNETRIIIREAHEGDKNFILSTWLNGNYFGTHLQFMPQGLYFSEYPKLILEILGRTDTEIMIACDESASEWCVGYSVSNADILHWIYVKSDFRKQGIATLLLKNKNISTVRALTKVGRAIAEKKRLIFNPL